MATTQKQRVLRLSLFLHRKEGLSEEEFQKKWTERHGPLVREWLARYGIVRYTQYHTPSSLRDQTTASSLPQAKEMRAPSYDGTAELLLRDPADYVRAFQDPFYKEQVLPEEDALFDKTKIDWNIGWEEVFVEDGKAVEGQESHYLDLGEAQGGDEGLGAEHLGERH